MTILAENYHSEGEADNEDRAYGLSKRYRSRGRVHDNWTDYAAVGRTEEKQRIMGAFYTIISEDKFTLSEEMYIDPLWKYCYYNYSV